MLDDTQRALNARFTYKADNRDHWKILAATGKVSGDCEDYSLTLIWLWEGQSMWRFWLALITFKYVLWFCRSPGGEKHLVVWCRGRGWTDNIQRELVRELPDRYRLFFPYVFPLVALKFMLRWIW